MKIKFLHWCLIIFFFLPIFKPINISSQDFSPKSASPTTLNWGQYAYIHDRCDLYITWSFTGSNPNIGLKAYIMDEDNFLRFVDLETFIAYTISDGSEYNKSGKVKLDHEASWYFVVVNLDESMNPTNVEMSASFVSSQINLIILILVVIVVGICLFIYYMSRHRHPPQLKQTPIFTSPILTSKTIFCPKCGTPLEIGMRFCPKCGFEVNPKMAPRF